MPVTTWQVGSNYLSSYHSLIYWGEKDWFVGCCIIFNFLNVILELVGNNGGWELHAPNCKWLLSVLEKNWTESKLLFTFLKSHIVWVLCLPACQKLGFYTKNSYIIGLYWQLKQLLPIRTGLRGKKKKKRVSEFELSRSLFLQ